MSLSSFQISLIMLAVLLLPFLVSLLIALASTFISIPSKVQGKLFGIPLVIAAICFLVLPIPGLILIQVKQFLVVDEQPFYFDILVDSTSAVMSFLVLLITGLVGIYSSWYYSKENRWKSVRFLVGIGLFSTAMLGLCMASSLFILFMFWELVGFTSWWIISFNNHKEESGKASSFIFLSSKIADIGLFLTVIIFLGMLNTTEILEIGNVLMLVDKDDPLMKLGLFLAGMGIVIAAMGKSAQGVFMLWLPRAMAGPTPASALMHAATMVTAGVVLVSRTLVLIPIPVLHILVLTGLLSALVAGYYACRTKDIKEILALSTIAQIGLMFSGFASFHAEIPLAHLFTHAFFKAGLFLVAGLLIKQAEKYYPHNGKLLTSVASLPLSYPFAATVIIMLAALLGLPSTGAFVTKGALFHQVYGGLTINQGILYYTEIGLFLIVNVSTGAYVNRVFYYFNNTNRLNKVKNIVISRVNGMIIALLALGSTWLVLLSFYSSNNQAFASLNIPEVHWKQEILILACTFIGMIIGWLWASKESKLQGLKAPIVANGSKLIGTSFNTIFTWVGQKILTIDNNYIDKSVASLARTVVVAGHVLYTLDKLVIDGAVNAVAGTVRLSGSVLSTQFHSGKVQTYVSFMITLIMILFILMIL